MCSNPLLVFNHVKPLSIVLYILDPKAINFVLKSVGLMNIDLTTSK